jgi:hypothetical protein
MTTDTSGVTVEVTTDGVSTGPVPLDDIHAAAGELFNGAAYDTPVPKLNGHRADTLKVAFNGGIEIDLMLPDQLDWFKQLRFGQELDLHVTATVTKHGWQLKVNPETGEEKATHTIGLQIHSIDTPEGHTV